MSEDYGLQNGIWKPLQKLLHLTQLARQSADANFDVVGLFAWSGVK